MKVDRCGLLVLLLAVWTLAPGSAAAEERPWLQSATRCPRGG